MKILVDEMPTQVGDCPYSNPTDMPWNDRTVWFCRTAQRLTLQTLCHPHDP